MPFTTVIFSFSSDSNDTRRVLLLAPIVSCYNSLLFKVRVRRQRSHSLLFLLGSPGALVVGGGRNQLHSLRGPHFRSMTRLNNAWADWTETSPVPNIGGVDWLNEPVWLKGDLWRFVFAWELILCYVTWTANYKNSGRKQRFPFICDWPVWNKICHWTIQIDCDIPAAGATPWMKADLCFWLKTTHTPLWLL